MKIRSECHRAYVEVLDTEEREGTHVCQACGRMCDAINASRYRVVAGDVILDNRGQPQVVSMVWHDTKRITVGFGGFHGVCIADYSTNLRLLCANGIINNWSNRKNPVVERARE